MCTVHIPFVCMYVHVRILLPCTVHMCCNEYTVHRYTVDTGLYYRASVCCRRMHSVCIYYTYVHIMMMICWSLNVEDWKRC